MSDWQIIEGDCLDVMAGMEPDSVDAIVTDPPAGISFMGKAFDSDRGGRQQWVGWLTSIMAECLRVLKPGGHALVWALPRTSHWTATAIEDAGFEIRDCITHLFGSGFPKSLDVSKAIDKAAGAEREVVGRYQPPNGTVWNLQNDKAKRNQNAYGEDVARSERLSITAPATDAARQWSGWGTALKPAAEFWYLARKPLAERNVASNVLVWGTGAVNVDGCRIAHGPDVDLGALQRQHAANPLYVGGAKPGDTISMYKPAGRWPANVVLSHHPECEQVGTKRMKANDPGITHVTRPGWGMSAERRNNGYADADGLETVPDYRCHPECPVRLLDEQSGERPGMTGGGDGNGWMHRTGTGYKPPIYGDTGGASRFFYCAKASRGEREAGLDGMNPTQIGHNLSTNACAKCGLRIKHNGSGDGCECGDLRETIKLPAASLNFHPTVKALALMRWLCRLVTPPGGLILDPFAGSGSTGCAAVLEGFRFVGIEQDADYCEIARKRIAHWAGPVFAEVSP